MERTYWELDTNKETESIERTYWGLLWARRGIPSLTVKGLVRSNTVHEVRCERTNTGDADGRASIATFYWHMKA